MSVLYTKHTLQMLYHFVACITQHERLDGKELVEREESQRNASGQRWRGEA